MKTNTPLSDLLRRRSGDSAVDVLASILASRGEFRPFPSIDDRERWSALPADVRNALSRAGEVALGEPWPLLVADRYLDYRRSGDRSRYEAGYFGRRRKLGTLVLAECVEDGGRFLDEIVNGMWLLCEESSWCVPAHVGVQRAGMGLPDVEEPIIDLFAAETGALLSWIDYLLAGRLGDVSPLVRPRIAFELRRRILEPFATRDDFWWMGFTPRSVNNWNPWINSNLLACILLAEDDPGRRAEAVEKTIRSVDCFLGPYPADGGCDEGPSYWGRAGASLFDFLELLAVATGEEFDAFDLPIVAEVGRFVHRVHIDGDQFVNFADAPAVVEAPASLIVRYGRRIRDRDLECFGRWLLARRGPAASDPGLTASPGRLLPELFWTPESDGSPIAAPLHRDVWLPEIELLLARDSEGSSAGFLLAAKGGNNDESHNHNDVGTFVVYLDGNPVLVDAGVETYRRQTFSDERYSIWTMQSAFHTLLPTVDGVMQSPGREFAAHSVARTVSDERTALELDLSAAYPREAGVERWHRAVALVRGRSVVVEDDYHLDRVPRRLELAILTPCTVSLGGSGRITLSQRPLPSARRAADAIVRYDGSLFSARCEEIPISDERMRANWGEALYRIVFALRQPAATGAWSFSVERGT